MKERKNFYQPKVPQFFFQFSRAPKYLKKKDLFVIAAKHIYVLPRLHKCKSNNGSNLVNKIYLMMD